MNELKTLYDMTEMLDIGISALAGSIEFVRLNYDNCGDTRRLGDVLFVLQNEAKRVVKEAEEVNALVFKMERR